MNYTANKDKTFFDTLLFEFKNDLLAELNIKKSLTDDEIIELLSSIISEYELEFKNDFTEIFLYNYYKNLLNSPNFTMEKIISFTKEKKSLENKGKNEVLKAERQNCKDVLYLYNFAFVTDEKGEDYFISQITGRKIPVSYKVSEIIKNNDIFFVPPKGDPKLRGPHITSSFEYDSSYWFKFKENIKEYINKFEKTHTQDYLDDLNDYRSWLSKYRTLKTCIDLKRQFIEKGERHVKN